MAGGSRSTMLGATGLVPPPFAQAMDSPKKPKVPAAPPPPQRADVSEEEAKKRALARKRRGRASTILAGERASEGVVAREEHQLLGA